MFEKFRIFLRLKALRFYSKTQTKQQITSQNSQKKIFFSYLQKQMLQNIKLLLFTISQNQIG
jgi:ribosomal protein S21